MEAESSQTVVMGLRADNDHLINQAVFALLLSRDESLPRALLLLYSGIAPRVEGLEEIALGTDLAHSVAFVTRSHFLMTRTPCASPMDTTVDEQGRKDQCLPGTYGDCGVADEVRRELICMFCWRGNRKAVLRRLVPYLALPGSELASNSKKLSAQVSSRITLWWYDFSKNELRNRKSICARRSSGMPMLQSSSSFRSTL